jgi:hypothetical protein
MHNMQRAIRPVILRDSGGGGGAPYRFRTSAPSTAPHAPYMSN